jgi:hypothetical protein
MNRSAISGMKSHRWECALQNCHDISDADTARFERCHQIIFNDSQHLAKKQSGRQPANSRGREIHHNHFSSPGENHAQEDHGEQRKQRERRFD